MREVSLKSLKGGTHPSLDLMLPNPIWGRTQRRKMSADWTEDQKLR